MNVTLPVACFPSRRPTCQRPPLAKAEHERTDQDRDLELAISLDHADSLGVVFERRRGKERSKPMVNSVWGGFGVHSGNLLVPLG